MYKIQINLIYKRENEKQINDILNNAHLRLPWSARSGQIVQRHRSSYTSKEMFEMDATELAEAGCEGFIRVDKMLRSYFLEDGKAYMVFGPIHKQLKTV